MKNLIPAILILVAPAAFAAPLAETTFVAFEVETTGFSPATERIIEIGAVKYRNGTLQQIKAGANGFYPFDGSRS